MYSLEQLKEGWDGTKSDGTLVWADINNNPPIVIECSKCKCGSLVGAHWNYGYRPVVRECPKCSKSNYLITFEKIK